jgi:hypothetical protein
VNRAHDLEFREFFSEYEKQFYYDEIAHLYRMNGGNGKIFFEKLIHRIKAKNTSSQVFSNSIENFMVNRFCFFAMSIKNWFMGKR